eukprot:PhM_4_TR18607/c0_g1_i1/m.30928
MLRCSRFWLSAAATSATGATTSSSASKSNGKAPSTMPFREVYPTAAKIAGHPESIQVPKNFRWHDPLMEQVPLPRGTCAEPLYFVLSVIYYNQPCRMAQLWSLCSQVPFVPLDSRRHLRQVVHQARHEGWVFFEKNAETHQWYVYPTRERHEELKVLVRGWREAWMQRVAAGSGGSEPANVAERTQSTTAPANAAFQNMSPQDRVAHMEKVQEQLFALQTKLAKHERTSMDYLPYTDPNGRVHFMWWYDTTGTRSKARELGMDDDDAMLSPGPEIPAIPEATVTGGAPDVAGLESAAGDPNTQERTRAS